MNETYQFCFTLYRNDWVKIVDKKQTREGYFSGIDRSTGAINLWAHDRDQRVGNKGLIRGIGIKTAISVEKYHVDLLGNLFKAKQGFRKNLKSPFQKSDKEVNSELEKRHHIEPSLS